MTANEKTLIKETVTILTKLEGNSLAIVNCVSKALESRDNMEKLEKKQYKQK